MKKSNTVYLLAMGISGLVFGLITTFCPRLMQLFQTQQGVAANTPFSDNVWLHEGLDVLSVSFLIIALSRGAVGRTMLRTTAIVALMPAVSIVYSLLTTPYWNMLFIGPAVSCVVFSVWGFVLAGKATE